MESPVLSWDLIAHAIRSVPDCARKILKAWLVWFWRLGAVSKIVVTGVEVVCLWAVLPHVPIMSEWRRVILEVGILGLCFLLLAGILFSNPSRR